MSDYHITLKHEDFMYLLEHCTYHPKDNLWPMVVLDSNICPNCGTEDAWHYDNKSLTVSCASCGCERTDMYLSGSAVPNREGGGGEVGWRIPSVIFLMKMMKNILRKFVRKRERKYLYGKSKTNPHCYGRSSGER